MAQNENIILDTEKLPRFEDVSISPAIDDVVGDTR